MSTTVETLAENSQYPIGDMWLESLQDQFNEHHNYYRFLYHLVLARKPAVALEIGTERGISSAYMAAAAKTYGGHVIGIDLYSHEMTRTLINSRYGNYHFIEGNSIAMDTAGQVEVLVKGLGPIGLVFQDSSHHYLESRREWDIYSQLTDSGALWVCDDITPDFHDPIVDPPGKNMVSYFEERPGRKKLYPGQLHVGNAIGVIVLD